MSGLAASQPVTFCYRLQLDQITRASQILLSPQAGASNSQSVSFALRVPRQLSDNMPRFKINNREYKALVDLRQVVGPLIAKSISRDRKTVSSLKVLNSWENLTIEISQLFLYLNEQQELSEEDYDDFRNGLHNVLSLIDERVDKNLVPTDQEIESSGQAGEVAKGTAAEAEHAMLGYQKLEALVHRAADQEDSIDPSLSFHLPAREEESVELEKIVTDFNVSNFARRPTAEQLGEDDSGPVDLTYHTNPKAGKSRSNIDDESQACTARLLKVLMDNVARSNCGCAHLARLQIRDPVLSTSLHGGLRHNVFMSTCRTQGEWQETTYEVVSQLTSPILRNPKLRNVRNVCKTIETSFRNGRKLDVLVHAQDLLHDPKQLEFIGQPQLKPILSLEDVLDVGSSHFTPGDKVILAANLARALLRMFSGDMAIREITAKDIYFLFNERNGMVAEGHNPYLACSLSSRRDHEKSEVDEIEKHAYHFESERRKDFGDTIKFPMLVSFGELLMEIALGRKMGPYDCRLDIALLAEIDPKHYTGQVVKMVGRQYVDVIKECLLANQNDIFDSDSDSDSESEWGDDTARISCKLNGQDREEEVRKKRREAEESLCKNVIRYAVASLEKAKTIFVPKTSLNSPFQFKVQIPTRGQTNATKAWVPTDRSGRQATGGRSLDNVRLNIRPTDRRVVWAAQFFDGADDFYQSNIRDLPVTENNRIRVAVLDTGVDDTSSFWRGLSHIRKRKDSPIKLTKYFIGDSINDELGHGTNMAAIISKIAPEADLYIAKISRGREAEGTQQIIDAIDWAVKNGVHVINMSFCLPKNPRNEKVRKKIEEATFNGATFVAAASNYGNNESRGFPAKLLQVICVHAVDGNGNKSGMNPPPMPGAKNFGSLGVAVKSEWDADEVYLEGTSYATPVVSGMISNVLRFVQYAWERGFLAEEYYKEAFSSRGMSNILGEMAERTSDGYDYIRAKWKTWGETDTVQDVATKIKSAMEKDMD